MGEIELLAEYSRISYKPPLIPPIKCQGIKTKLVYSIKECIEYDAKWDANNGRFIEPFLGSGVVLFNIAPTEAMVSDINPYIIMFYQGIQKKEITPHIVQEYLEENGKQLATHGEEYYYKIRNRFNVLHNPLDFLFLNRSCFNGVMRFNNNGRFNTPFCHKLDRFRRAYITKIVNQVSKVAKIINGKNWKFICSDWREILASATSKDFVYLDPPYMGRHTGYYGMWTEKDEEELVKMSKELPCPFILSTWSKNKYRINDGVKKYWTGFQIKKINHFYHVGSTESLRNEMEEALVLGNP